MREWNRLNTEIRNSISCKQFWTLLLSFIKSTCSLFSIHHPVGFKLLFRLGLGFNHLHKFRHNFHDTLNPLCFCSLQFENVSHLYLSYHNFSSACLDIMNDLNLIDATTSQIKLLLQTNFYMVIQRKVHKRISKLCRALSNIYLQQNDLMNHSSKDHTNMHALYIHFIYALYIYIYIYIIYIYIYIK